MNNFQFSDGKFTIKNFNAQPPFTSFLPAVAGVNGRPLWAFYINRGQGIAGFGVGGKELPIMEFSPAEIAYANAPRQGFRTFLKIDGKFSEPFSVENPHGDMSVSRSGFCIEDRAESHSVSVEYFGVPNRNFAALGRIVRYTNTGASSQQVEFLDGLAQILPYGLSNSAFKETGNLLKSWAAAEGVADGYAFVKMRSSSSDTAEVSAVTGGNFFLPVGVDEIVVEPKLLFGEDRTKTRPTAFERGLTLENQCTENEIFCAFAHTKRTVGAGQTVTFCQLIGYAGDERLVSKLKKEISAEEVISMRDEAEREVEKIASLVETQTAFPVFDEYIKQSYFDNVLRGGMPVTVGGQPYYVFSRKHGDPERDYNAFHIEPKPYSCGNGNFRDVAQNRRNDVLITPQCGDFNVRYFFSLLQADGYNPLSVSGVKYTCNEVPEKHSAHAKFLGGKFTLGEAVCALGLDEKGLDELISVCQPVYEAKFSEGYWTDHFVYLIDLVKAYLAVYPENERNLLYKTPLKWFSSSARVLPRSRQTVIKGGKIRRLHGVEEFGDDGWLQSGGKDYTTSLMAKLIFLIAIKTATLDPEGCGVDMEGGKPGWCDATNGLPALFGSNVADAIELLRLANTVSPLVTDGIEWSAEQADFFGGMLALLSECSDSMQFYFESRKLKERYLESVYSGFDGNTAATPKREISLFLELCKSKLQDGLKRARELADGWVPTYLTFEVTEYERLENGFVLPENFKASAVPHFVEGVAKALAVGQTDDYVRAKHSQLYDDKLKLFKTSEPLDALTQEIGRIRSFPSGWLERESCFLHMSYKLILALLQAGMYEEFYSEIKNGLVPFMPAERYGRSTLENSSFIVTSNHSDKCKFGKGYQARLTGANAEVMSMWRTMFGCEQPFKIKDGKLAFELSPKLHREFFADGKASFTLFGKTKVTYLNPGNINAWDARIESYRLDGKEYSSVTCDLAENVRNGKYKNIEVVLK